MEKQQIPLYQMLQKVDVNKELGEQLDVLKEFDNLPQEQFDELTSGWYIKHEEAGMVMQYLPVERFYDRLGLLLEHLEDRNWPAASRVADVLLSIGEPALPEIRKRFEKGAAYADWLYPIIRWIIRYWDETLILKVKKELIEVVGYADGEGASIAALEVLQRILSPDEFQSLHQRLRDSYAGNTSLTEDLDYAFEE
jgi:hypothetical protein